MYELRGTLVKILDEIIIKEHSFLGLMDEIINKIYSGYNVNEIYDNILNAYKLICTLINKEKSSHNTEMISRIKNYINDNFKDSQLCLSSIAEQLNMSEVYLSKFFKDVAGENFSSYLETVRIEHACKLLCEKKISIASITEKVGYNSPHVFRRAFKRQKGVNPTDYINS